MWLDKGNWTSGFRLRDPCRERGISSHAACAVATVLYTSNVVCVLTQEPARVNLLALSYHSLTATGSWRIDESKWVKVHVAHCVPCHHGRPCFYLCYPDLQDLFACLSLKMIFICFTSSFTLWRGTIHCHLPSLGVRYCHSLHVNSHSVFNFFIFSWINT